MKYIKRILPTVLLILLVSVLTVSAADVKRISGFSESQLSLSQQDELEKRCGDIFETYSLDIGVHITYNTNGKSSMVYADDYYDSNGFGQAPDYSGAILVLNMQDREIYISACSDGGKYLTDERIDNILDKLIGYVRDENYYEMCSVFLDEAERYYAMEPKTGPGSSENEMSKTQKTVLFQSVYIVVALAAGAIAFFIVLHSYTVMPKKPKYQIGEHASLSLNKNVTYLIDSRITRRRAPQENNSSSHSSAGSSHTSSAGRTHSGGGRSF